MKQEIQNLLKHSYSIIQLEKSIEQECLEYRYNYYKKRAEDKNFNFEFTIEEFN